MPSTGFDDVKRVALARLIVDNIPSIQVDWALYGPKLAQVVLTMGADDVDAVSAEDDDSEGRRRAPLEEIRRNIRAAGLEPSSGTAASTIADAAMNRPAGSRRISERPAARLQARADPRFELRFDCAGPLRRLLHDNVIDVGLIPSIEYLRGPASAASGYRIVPDLAVASFGPVASVAIYTTRR